MSIVHLTRADLAACPISAAITTRGMELLVDDTVADAHRLFAKRAVRVLPVLDGATYLGAVDRDAIDGAELSAAIGPLAAALVPTALAATPATEALAALDRHGGQRLVLLAGDGASYVGLVCLRGDRERLCVDAELGHDPTALPTERTPSVSTIAPETHVAALVLAEPGRARVFERFGIDYCCGGKTPLEAACADRGLDVGAVIAALEEPLDREADDVDWTAVPVADLCEHIVDRHHAYLREELPLLGQLVDKVARAHGGAHPELVDVQAAFTTLAGELEQHLAKEEQILFPACVALEEGAAGSFPFGSVENPIRMMLHEHDEVAAGLARLRDLTGGYRPPAEACNSYRAMLDRLHALETDTHRHVHEENNILFPRAVALEAAA